MYPKITPVNWRPWVQSISQRFDLRGNRWNLGSFSFFPLDSSLCTLQWGEVLLNPLVKVGIWWLLVYKWHWCLWSRFLGLKVAFVMHQLPLCRAFCWNPLSSTPCNLLDQHPCREAGLLSKTNLAVSIQYLSPLLLHREIPTFHFILM